MAPSTNTRLAYLAVLATLAVQLVAAQVFNCQGGSLYVVAHPDDDLLFQSPDLWTDMQNSLCVTTVFLTSGDSGVGAGYARSREAGNEAATAQMAAVADTWTEFNATFGGQPVVVHTLVGAPQVQKVWFRLPDGDVDGTGYSATGYQTLRELYFGSIGSITNQPKTATYTMGTLKQAIGQIITARAPDNVRTLDHLSNYDAGDHSDHLTTARIVQSLVGTYAPNAGFAGYMGYPIANLAPTMSTSSAEFNGKANAFFAYTPYDVDECSSYSSCSAAGRGEAQWLTRQYKVTPALAEICTTGAAQVPVTMPDQGYMISNLATASVSTAWAGGYGYAPSTAFALIDGVISGYPGNTSAEWISASQTIGATATLSWPKTYSIASVVLYDRPSAANSITGGTLTFNDGTLLGTTTVNFGALANDGSATLITLSKPIVAKSVMMTVTSVTGSTTAAGLAEFQVYGTQCANCPVTTGNTTATTTTSTTLANNGTDSTGNGTIVYADGSSSQLNSTSSASNSTASANSTSSAVPTASASSTSGGLFGFLGGNKAVSSSVVSSSVASASASSTASAKNLGTNYALSATAYSSSAGSIQPASAGIDGNIGGYTSDGGNPKYEWASNGEGAGAWYLLIWPSAVTVSSIQLFDRPNPSDQVLGASILFADQSTVSIGALPNDGQTPGVVTFTPRSTTAILVTITSVSSTTGNAGLSEMQVYGPSSATSSALSATGYNATATASATATGLNATASAANATLTATSSFANATLSASATSAFANATVSGNATASGVSATASATGSANLTSSVLPTGSASASASANATATGSVTASLTDSASLSASASAVLGSYLSGSAATSAFASSSVASSSVVSPSVLSSSAVSSAASSSVVSSSVLPTTSSAVSSSAVTSSKVASSSVVSSSVVSSSVASSSVVSSSAVPSTTSKVSSSTLSSPSTMMTLVRTTSASVAPTTALSTAAPQATHVNIALLGTADASSSISASPASGVNDGVIGGASLLGLGGLAKNEWVATTGANSWVQLNFTANYLIKEVLLFGRTNTVATQVTAGTLTFSDGTSVDTGAIATSGTSVVLPTGGITVNWVRFTATKVSGVAGLAELQIYNYAPPSATASAPASKCTAGLLNLGGLLC